MTRPAAAVFLLALAACGDEPAKDAAPVPPPAPAMPADPHAGMGNPMAPVQRPAAPVSWTVPEGWKSTPPSSGMRHAQFDVAVDAQGDPVQCIVFSGPMGGDEENIQRWTGQMGAGAREKATIENSERAGLKVTRVEATGAYTDSMRPGGGKTYDDAAMLAAIVTAPSGGKVYVRLVGPKDLVEKAEPQFDAFLASMK